MNENYTLDDLKKEMKQKMNQINSYQIDEIDKKILIDKYYNTYLLKQNKLLFSSFFNNKNNVYSSYSSYSSVLHNGEQLVKEYKKELKNGKEYKKEKEYKIKENEEIEDIKSLKYKLKKLI